MRIFLALSAFLALLVTRATLTSAQRVPPCECPDDFAPVCGRDMRTYPNDCTLVCVGQKKAYNGQCRTRGTFY